MRSQSRRLSNEDFFQLTQWVQANHERLVENAPPLTKLCDFYREEKGRSVSESTMRNAIKTTGVKYSPLVNRDPTKNRKTELELLRSQVAELSDQSYSQDLIIQEQTAAIAQTYGMIRELADALGYRLKGDPIPAKSVAVAKFSTGRDPRFGCPEVDGGQR